MKRVVITGVGVVAPNGVGIASFTESLRQGRSGITRRPFMQERKMGCQVAGVPDFDLQSLAPYFNEFMLRSFKNTGAQYGCAAGIEAWLDAGFPIDPESKADWDAGCIFGTNACDVNMIRWGVDFVDNGENRKLGSRFIEQQMSNATSAYLAGLIGLGNHVFANASACSTGTEALFMAYEKIREGKAKKILAGSTEATSDYIWAAFDSMRVLSRRFNDAPEKASRPMSATAAGFVPAGGAGAFVLEERESALARGAYIYAEIAGGAVNCGGQRTGGSMTAPNPEGVQHCIRTALDTSGVKPQEIDLVAGHLTATMADPVEIENWSKALQLSGRDFPHINSVKSMIGHCLGAAGSIEIIAVLMQMKHSFIHANINCEDLHPSIPDLIHPDCIPQQMVEKPVHTVIKANFGFGDVNACVVLKK